jgi:hypothetical protein
MGGGAKLLPSAPGGARGSALPFMYYRASDLKGTTGNIQPTFKRTWSGDQLRQ